MNPVIPMTLSLLCAFGAARAQSAGPLMGEAYLSARLLAGTTSLEGPAITGPESFGEFPGEESENGFGLQLEAGRPLGQGIFLRGLAEWVRYGDGPGFDMTRLSFGLGLGRSLGSWAGIGWYGFGIAAANLVRNACQHAADGMIGIVLLADRLEIGNPFDPDARPPTRSEHAGLGMGIVERIAGRCGWTFIHGPVPGALPPRWQAVIGFRP